MAIVRYEPFSLLNHPFFRPFLTDITEEWPGYTLAEGLNVYEENNQVIVEAAVPGIPADKLDITYEDGVLHISGRVEEKEEEKKNRVVHRKQKVSAFSYTTALPRPIDPESISAQVENGVVRVSARIAKAAQAKKIPVKANTK